MTMLVGIALFAIVIPSAIQGCGVRPGFSRIINGQNAAPHSWPWQISLRVNGRHICGGSLISPHWVITATHCIHRNPRPSGYTVVVGAHTQYGSTAVQRTHRVSHLYKHRGFSMRHFRNDITLLKLSTPAQFSAQVNSVCLPQAGSRIPAGTRCYLTGWGNTVGGGQSANILQQAVLPVADDRQCQRTNNRLITVDPRSMICAGGHRGAGSCHGDSGGPFVCNEGGKWVLRGAVSWGHNRCRTDYYTVFARVSEFINWINSIISSCKDMDRRCSGWRGYCSWHNYVRRNCKRTCNFC